MDEGLNFAVKYPFSESAKRMIDGVTLSERIIDLAVQRIEKALKGETSTKLLFHESDKKEEIASFAAARMILGYLRNSFLTTRFAVNESKIVRSQLDREDEDLVDAIASQFGIVTTTREGKILIELPAYLKYSTRAPHYRLINRRLVNGLVEITSSEKRRLIEEAVRKHVENIPFVKDPSDSIKLAAKKLINSLPKTESRITVKMGDHPPCIAKLLDEMKKHENLPHHARWYLATYLLAIGMSEEEITKLYSDLPDFSEKITRYQVGHIKKKGYNVPSCATVMTYGLCCAVCRIGNPMNWHGITKERKQEIKNEMNRGR